MQKRAFLAWSVVNRGFARGVPSSSYLPESTKARRRTRLHFISSASCIGVLFSFVTAWRSDPSSINRLIHILFPTGEFHLKSVAELGMEEVDTSDNSPM